MNAPSPAVLIIEDESDLAELLDFNLRQAGFAVTVAHDGAEGLADMVVLLAIEEAARTGRAVPIALPPRPRHPAADMIRICPVTDRRLLL